VRRGAASCRAVLGSCPVAAAVRAVAQVPSPRSRRGWPSAPSRRDPGEVGPPSGGRRSPGCPDAGQAGRCPVRLVRSAVGMSVQPVERTSSIQASGVQASGVQRPGHPGVRTDRLWCPRRCRRAVRAALDPGWLGGGPPRPQWVDVPLRSVGGVVACLHRAGRVGMVRRWPWLAGMRSTAARGRRLAGVPAAAPPGRRADTGLVQAREPAGWRGVPGQSKCSPAPRGVLGRSPAWC
jgi:hypothetical protein